MKRNLLVVLLFASLAGYAQNTLNNYKYVLVPEKFDFLKDVNQYGLNFLTKALLEDKGFTVYFDNNELPKELAADRCSLLKAEVAQRKALFSTNLTLTLKDCQGNAVFKGKEGKSREKDYSLAYSEALQDAFKSLNEVPYAYSAPVPTAPRSTTATSPVVTQPAATPAPAEQKDAAGTLYAQETSTGFQLIDTTPKIVFTLFKTSAPDYFIATKNALQGIVFKKDTGWVFEYYQEGKLMAEKLLIKF